MPIFEYQCEKCEKVEEVLVSDPRKSPDVACGHCGSKQMSRLFSSFSAGSGAGPKPARRESPWSGGGCGGSCTCH